MLPNTAEFVGHYPEPEYLVTGYPVLANTAPSGRYYPDQNQTIPWPDNIRRNLRANSIRCLSYQTTVIEKSRISGKCILFVAYK